MLVGREAYRVAIPVAPREGLDRILRMCRVEWSAQDGTIANTQVRRAFKRLNRRAGALRTEGGVAARLHAASRVEHVVAQHDVLTRNVLLILAAAIIATHYAAVGRRSLRPVDPPPFERQLFCWVIASRQSRNEGGYLPGHRIHDDDS